MLFDLEIVVFGVEFIGFFLSVLLFNFFFIKIKYEK